MAVLLGQWDDKRFAGYSLPIRRHLWMNLNDGSRLHLLLKQEITFTTRLSVCLKEDTFMRVRVVGRPH